MPDRNARKDRPLRCPSCSHIVESYFDHVAIPCQHDMTPEEITTLLQEERRATRNERTANR